MSKSRKDVEAIVSGMGVNTVIISELINRIKKNGGSAQDLYRLATPAGDLTLDEIAKLVVGETGKTEGEILRLISSDEDLIVGACDGSELLVGYSDIRSCFKEWGADEPGMPTGKTPVDVYELKRGAYFREMFSSINEDLSKVCLTQAQIVGFIWKYPQWIRKSGSETFFLFMSHRKLFVADVSRFTVEEFRIYVHRFDSSGKKGEYDWEQLKPHRIVAPRQ